MKKIIILILLNFFMLSHGYTQVDIRPSHSIIDLRKQLEEADNDTIRALVFAKISYEYAYFNFDSSFVYAEKALKLSDETDFARGRANALIGFGNLYLRQGDYPKALQYEFRALELSEKFHFEKEKAISLMELGFTYHNLSDYPRALDFSLQARELFRRNSWSNYNVENEIAISNTYIATNKKDSALVGIQKIYNDPENKIMLPIILEVLGNIHTSLGNFTIAKDLLYKAIPSDIENNDLYSLIWAYNSLAKLYKATNQSDSCIYYAKKGLTIAENIQLKEGILFNSLILSIEFEATDAGKALFYRKKYDDVYNKMYGQDKVLALQKTLAEQQERQKQFDEKRTAEKNRLRQFAFMGGLSFLFLIALVLYRNNRQKQKANDILQQQKQKIESTLLELRSTQSQLIQSEKMASLGELTAGIAHEIQNPLNFVNNFSDLSNELIVEIEEERAKNPESRDENLVSEVLTDIKQNLEKINHHGKRADAIVKGMLQHSRTSTGQKEPTDINALADEYLRLSYHGLRAKDKSFNANFRTEFDESLPNINVIPQDIGRVLLNLINNAFYAVSEAGNSKLEARVPHYMPEVLVSTRKLEDKIEIRVKDNGNGIPQNIKDKIFQPFFTTKPTGQGTGLGLSLSYDLVKAHGGELKMETNVGEGTQFIIQLPII
jgi:two-component system, NtrC family, sensor kinase